MGKTSLYWRWLFPLLHRSGRAWFAHPKASREAARRACLRANLTLVLCGATLSSWPALSTGAWSGLLGASLLARPDSRHLLVVGAGTVATSLVKAYTAVMPGIKRVSVWSRRPEQAQSLIDGMPGISAELVAVADLRDAVGQADIVTSATMARQPVILGDWVRPGTHVDLIGAFKADMREADDALIAGAALFVDSRATTLGHIGELMMPIASGAITPDSVLGDLYDLVRPDARRRLSDDEITLYKNGGGAHLDLMIASWIARVMARGTARVTAG